MLIHDEVPVTNATGLLIRWLHIHLQNLYYHQTLCRLLSSQLLHQLLSYRFAHMFPNSSATIASGHYHSFKTIPASSKSCHRGFTHHLRRPRLSHCNNTFMSFLTKNEYSFQFHCTHLARAQLSFRNFHWNPWNALCNHAVPRPVGCEYGSHGLSYVDCAGLPSNVRLLKLSYCHTKKTVHSSKLQPLECVHTLEMEDPLHRYGSYLRPYFMHWLSLPNPRSSFFEWLDSPAGRSTQLSNSGKRIVPRSHLDLCRVTYCDNRARRQMQVVVDQSSGRLLWRLSKRPVCTNDGRRWIFVIDQLGKMYVNPKQKAKFHHSSFVSGKPVLAAGRLQSVNGLITAVSAHSGHYQTPMPRLVAALMLLFGDACLPIVTSNVPGGEKLSEWSRNTIIVLCVLSRNWGLKYSKRELNAKGNANSLPNGPNRAVTITSILFRFSSILHIKENVHL